MKKKIIMSFVLCSLFAVLVPFIVFGQTNNNNWYHSTIDSKLTDFNNGKYWIEKITYENGTTTSINPVDRFTFLMINNSFIPNVDIKNKNGYSLVPIRLITEELGGLVEWDAKKSVSTIVYNNNKIILKAGDTNVVINGKTVTIPIAAQIVDNRMYVPLRAVAETFGVVSYNIGVMPFGNPLISIDTRTKNVTKEEAVKLAVDAMKQAYTTFLKNDKYVNGSDSSNKALAEIKQKMDNIGYKYESAGYWILTGPYEILVDKSTGNLFFKYGTGTKVGGSYSEGIFPVDVNDIDVFVGGYFAGGGEKDSVNLTDNEVKDILNKLIPKAVGIYGMFNGTGSFKSDATKTIPGEKDYCLVTGENGKSSVDVNNVKSIADLKKVVEDALTKDIAQKLFYSIYLEMKDPRPLYKDYEGQLYVDTHNGGHGWATKFLIDTAKIKSQKEHVVEIALDTTVLDDPYGKLIIKIKYVNGKWLMASGLDDYESIINGTVK
jgi:hypothetical protein